MKALGELLTVDTTQVEGFTRFVKTTEPRLRIALCSAFGRQVGLEATADALAYGWEHWQRIQAMDNPQGYLWTVGRNRAKRIGGRRSMAFGSVAVEHMPWVEPGLPAALEALSEKQRLVVMLTDGYDWTQREVADLLGVSVGTVQRHKERAHKRLKKSLGVET